MSPHVAPAVDVVEDVSFREDYETWEQPFGKISYSSPTSTHGRAEGAVH